MVAASRIHVPFPCFVKDGLFISSSGTGRGCVLLIAVRWSDTQDDLGAEQVLG